MDRGDVEVKAGLMRISEELLLDWLRFKGGRVRGSQWHYEDNTLSLVIEHPDMPEVGQDGLYPLVHPTYRTEELLGYRYERLP